MVRRGVAALLLLTGCKAPEPLPNLDASGPSIRYQWQRVVHAEFGDQNLADLDVAAQRIPAALQAEFGRQAADSWSWQQFRNTEARRWELPVAGAQRLLAQELDRGPQGLRRYLQADAGTAVSSSWADGQSRRLIEGLAGIPAILGLDQLPLSHPDDREFRTEPEEARPEAGLWERIARRLPPW